MKSIIHRWILAGALTGCTLGILFTLAMHNGLHGGIGLVLVALASPVYWVVLHWNLGETPAWLPWAVGVLFLGGIYSLIGCVLGTAIALLQKLIALARSGKTSAT